MSPIVETLPCVGGVTITLLKVGTAARCSPVVAITWDQPLVSVHQSHMTLSLQAPYFDASFSMASGPDIMALPFIHEAVRIATKVQSCGLCISGFCLPCTNAKSPCTTAFGNVP